MLEYLGICGREGAAVYNFPLIGGSLRVAGWVEYIRAFCHRVRFGFVVDRVFVLRLIWKLCATRWMGFHAKGNEVNSISPHV